MLRKPVAALKLEVEASRVRKSIVRGFYGAERDAWGRPISQRIRKIRGEMSTPAARGAAAPKPAS